MVAPCIPTQARYKVCGRSGAGLWRHRTGVMRRNSRKSGRHYAEHSIRLSAYPSTAQTPVAPGPIEGGRDRGVLGL
jgi:hypothetical protein